MSETITTPAPKNHAERKRAQYETERYARNCTRPTTILFRVADELKLSDENIVALARAFHAEQVACIEAKDIPEPFLDTCMPRALAKMTGKGAAS